MKNIFTALDLTDDNKIIIDKSAEMAAKYGAKLWLVHVAAPDPDFVGYDAGPQFTRDERADELRKEHIWIQELADNVKAQNIDCEGLLVQGSTVETILEEAASVTADLIIVGYHEQGFLHNAWFGDNTMEIVKRSAVPVLVIPVKNFN